MPRVLNRYRVPCWFPVVLACLAVLAGPVLASETAADCPQGGTPNRLLITVTGTHSAAGNITVTVYGQERRRFLAHHGSILVTRVPINGCTAKACVAVSPPGIYALAIYHDENDNHHFDRTLLGLPAEGYGFSNDAPALLGLPSFDAVRFVAGPGDTRLSIRIRY